MREVIFPNKNEIIEENRKEIQNRLRIDPTAPEAFAVNEERLDDVLKLMKQQCNEPEWRKKIIKKAAYFIGGLSWAQPFAGANKTTAFLITVLFMRDNGINLRIPVEAQDELIRLMYEIQEQRAELCSELIESLILYIDKYSL